jgi:diadenosine tetraphosphate (Ap4A) HIT family hydrolase
MSEGTAPSVYVARLPIGKRLATPSLVEEDIFPFEGELRVKVLDAPVLPEPPRNGEAGGGECWSCAHPDEGVIWRNSGWNVRRGAGPSGLPLVLTLHTNAHHDLEDLPAELAAEFGVMIQRVVRAIGMLDGIGRVHCNRWGDGSQHLHVWFLPRPAGMLQLRGACIALWDDILQPVPEGEWRQACAQVAAALAAVDGTAAAFA